MFKQVINTLVGYFGRKHYQRQQIFISEEEGDILYFFDEKMSDKPH